MLDVPGLPPSDGCPAGGALPMFIQAGFLLSGGVGYVDLSEAFFDVVSSAIAVTGGPPPLATAWNRYAIEAEHLRPANGQMFEGHKFTGIRSRRGDH